MATACSPISGETGETRSSSPALHPRRSSLNHSQPSAVVMRGPLGIKGSARLENELGAALQLSPHRWGRRLETRCSNQDNTEKQEVTDDPPTFLPQLTLTSSQYASPHLSSGHFVPPIGRWRRSFNLLLLERSLGSKGTDARGARRGEWGGLRPSCQLTLFRTH